MWFASPRRWVEHQKVVIHLLINFHDAGLIAASVAVVGGREDGHNLLFVRPIVALIIQEREEIVKSGFAE